MGTLDISGSEAGRRLRENDASRWSSGWETPPEPETAWHRLQEPLFRPALTTGCEIHQSDSIFAIGSCFARGVEVRLSEIGFDVASVTDAFDEFEQPREGR